MRGSASGPMSRELSSRSFERLPRYHAQLHTGRSRYRCWCVGIPSARETLSETERSPPRASVVHGPRARVRDRVVADKDLQIL